MAKIVNRQFSKEAVQMAKKENTHTHEKMLKIISHQENTKQKSNEIPLETNWDNYLQN